jgi:hypothetical protein
MKRRAAIEPVIGRLVLNHLAHSTGDAIYSVLTATGYNFSLINRWLRVLRLRFLIGALVKSLPQCPCHSAPITGLSRRKTL